MLVRKVQENDLLELTRWFESVSWDLPPVPNVVPKDGFVAEIDGVIVACAFMYVTGASCSFVQWTNTNPDVSDEIQSAGISAIISKLQEIAPKLNPPIVTIVTYTKSDKFAHRLKNLGFRSTFGFHQCTWVAKKHESQEV